MTRFFERLFQWTGGALFVISLAACGYLYLTTWATPSKDAGGWSAVAFNAIAFALFAVHHSLFARESVKRQVARIVPERLMRSFYVWTASLLLLAVLAVWQPVAADLYSIEGWPAVANAAVQLTGLWLIARSVAIIDPLELAGIKPASSSGNTLQITGPYRWVRHPIYLGWLLIFFGAAHMTGDRLAFAAITSVYLVLAIPWEERSLLRSLGNDYTKYRRQVRWRVVPYVY
jgi:methanethiol S-methyltransferase